MLEEVLFFRELARKAAVSLCAWSLWHRSNCVQYSMESGRTMNGDKMNCYLRSLLCSHHDWNQSEKDVSVIILEW